VILAVENVSHAYGGRPALRQFNLHCNARQILGILGPNGSGKSTLFKILSTLLVPDAGEVEVAGLDIRRLPHEVRKRIGVVFQSNSLDRQLTVEENLRAQGALHGLTGAKLRGRISECLARLGLTERRGDLVKSLSGGLARRAEIAKALLHEPPVILLDEPSTGLDPAARREMWELLRRCENATILLTTHLLDEAGQCDRLVLMHEGRGVLEGTPAELKATIGGEVIEFETADPLGLAAGLQQRFGLGRVRTEGRTVHAEAAGAHRLAAEAVEAFPGLIESVRFHRPSLEDVFLARTGARL
jgi:ABC-2 type transport system ATP-binding protein